MARPRSQKNVDLPTNLYRRKHKKTGAVYFAYRDPISKKEIGLGCDLASSVLEAQRRNAQYEDVVQARRAGAHLENGIPKIRRGVIDEIGLFEKSTILAAARSIKPVVGIYFLVDGSRIVYVGQSRDILLRLSAHLKDDEKVFTSFAVVEAEPHELDELEAKYIAKFTPGLNKRRPTVGIVSNRIPEKFRK